MMARSASIRVELPTAEEVAEKLRAALEALDRGEPGAASFEVRIAWRIYVVSVEVLPGPPVVGDG